MRAVDGRGTSTVRVVGLTVEPGYRRLSRICWLSRSSTGPKRTVEELDAKLKDVRIPRANLGPCPVCGHAIVEKTADRWEDHVVTVKIRSDL